MRRASAAGLLLLAVPLVGAGQAPKLRRVLLPGSPSPLVATVPTLSISPSSISFTAPNPAVAPVVTGSSPLTANLTLTKPITNKIWTLSVQAQGSTLVGSSGDAIPVGSISWTASGSVTGGNGSISVVTGSFPLSTSSVQTASGTEGSSDPFTAQVIYTFRFTDSWTYVPESYTQTVLLTLTVP